jgi:hypothetical protein
MREVEGEQIEEEKRCGRAEIDLSVGRQEEKCDGHKHQCYD